MTLEKYLEQARIKAVEQYGHRCNHDFSIQKHVDEHESMMQELFKQMKIAEDYARQTWEEENKSKKTKKESKNGSTTTTADQSNIL